MMSNYAIFFDYGNKTYRLPVNPEQIEVSSTQSITKYEILKLGEIAIPTHMELRKYSFEVELPHKAYHYIETPKKFKNSDYYLNKFQSWREKLIPVRFIAGKITNDNEDMKRDNGEMDLGNCINTLVLIEELTITEKAGEEGDKYVSFSLLEYREHEKKSSIITTTAKTSAKKKVLGETFNPKSTGSYIVQSGDTLWAIAKKYYGDGSKYSKIFNANKDKIKNPNLIKPGWKLVIP